MLNLAQSLRSACARTAASTLVAASAMVAGPAFASVWTEFGDAGQTQGTAQVVASNAPSAPLNSIIGSLGNQFDVDLFRIHINAPAAFSASTVGGNLMDTQLFLFSLSGSAIYMNDDDLSHASDPFSFLLSTLPAGSALGPIAAGDYLLGISLNGNDPVNATNDLLFANGLSTDVRGPAAFLNPKALAGFTGLTNFDERGAYTITITGADIAVPEPASAALALLACGLCGVATSRKSRRIAASASAAA